SQILEYYLNTVYFGNLAYGVEAASQTYFGKSAKLLNKSESAFLAGLIQAPAAYDPAVNPTAAFNRMDDVLKLMGQLGCIQMEHGVYKNVPYCITQTDISQLVVLNAQVKAKLSTFKPPTNNVKYPHFVNY